MPSKPVNSQTRFRRVARWNWTTGSVSPLTGSQSLPLTALTNGHPQFLHRSAWQHSSGIPTHMLWHSEQPTKATGHTDCHLPSTFCPNVMARYAQMHNFLQQVTSVTRRDRRSSSHSLLPLISRQFMEPVLNTPQGCTRCLKIRWWLHKY